MVSIERLNSWDTKRERARSHISLNMDRRFSTKKRERVMTKGIYK